MQTTSNKARKRALALARAAERGDEAARSKAAAVLAAHCTKHNLSVADIIAAAMQPDPTPAEALRRAAAGEATGQPGETTDAARDAMQRTANATGQRPERNAVKPKAKPAAPKPSKPADAAKLREATERAKLIGALRSTVSAIYNGPSLAVRSNPKRIAAGVYAALLAAPKHRTTLDRVSVRDESGLALIIKRGDKTGAFDPVALNFDAGIFSRLASVAFIAAAGDGFTLTAAGLSHARKAVRAAAERAKAA